MSENAIREQMNGTGQGRTGWEMRFVEWAWFWKSRWHTICELWMVGEWSQDFFKILFCSFEQDKKSTLLIYGSVINTNKLLGLNFAKHVCILNPLTPNIDYYGQGTLAEGQGSIQLISLYLQVQISCFYFAIKQTTMIKRSTIQSLAFPFC